MGTGLPKAYSYIRFSSPEQAKGDSYRRQKAAAEAYCLANDLELVNSKEYRFFDSGRSAYKGEHLDDTGELARFLTFVENGSIARGSVLIVESLDRLSRAKIGEALPRFLDLLKNGIDVYSSTDNTRYTSEFDVQQILIGIFQMSRAHSESSLKAERVSKAWRQKQKDARESRKPLGAACPYWIEYVNGAYKVIPDRVEVICQIFELAQAGYGHRAIAKILNDQAIPIFGSRKRNINGKWGSSSCSKILANRALLGEYQPTGLVNNRREKIGEPVLDFFPKVISEEDFYSAQASRASRRVSKASKQSENFNIWQGIAKCKQCGSAMHLVNKGRPPKGGKYLRCYSAAKGVCGARLVRLDQSELVLKEVLAKVDSLSLIQNSQAQLNKELSIVNVKVSDIQSRQMELKKQVLQLGGELPTMLVSVMIELEDELKSLKLNRERIKVDIKRDKIVSKEDFFSRLDLVTYEGRARANSLIKTLEIVIFIERGDDGVIYSVESEGKSVMSLKYTDNSVIHYWPKTREFLDMVKLHNDGEIFSLMNAELAIDVGEGFEMAADVVKLEAQYAEILAAIENSKQKK
ncbi:recombinase family protein [Pseudomonas chlororaphis subsp. aurantiaca]|uniref:recombinase family protein n=1 Tax=Pseudomonas chlororaphis TaxID=587753 RepID=UPI0027DBDC09|nr:recombinase family protein [Pseudomonas chlororaphis]WMI99763.1 recombinase family protein [Pseudomonas chlororaphis subsp. aurantiaca]